MTSAKLISLKSCSSFINRMASSSVRGVVSKEEGTRLVVDCMKKVGTPIEYAQQLADVLIEADYRGHYSHGLNRLEMYIKDVSSGTCDPKATPAIIKQTSATAWVDGKHGLGPVIGNFCMDLAIEKAKESGVGWVCAKGSNHFGIAGWYSMRALNHNLMGMSFTNTSPFLSPTRSKEVSRTTCAGRIGKKSTAGQEPPMNDKKVKVNEEKAALGTNPISVAAPGNEGDSYVLDMATTAVAVGKIEVQKRKNEPIPDGWAQDTEGKSTTDPDVGLKCRRLMPLGGAELTSGYKGYGLAMMVEIFCGILSGSHYGPNVRFWLTNEREADLGQCFIAVNPECFAPDFTGRLSDLMDHLRGMSPADESKPVLVPGDPERQHMALVDKEGGIRYHDNQLIALVSLVDCGTQEQLAQSLNVVPMELLKN